MIDGDIAWVVGGSSSDKFLRDWRVHCRPLDSEPYNVYNAPEWQPLLKLAEERTDLIRMMNPARSGSLSSSGEELNPEYDEYFSVETTEADDARITKTVVTINGRTMTQVQRRDREIDTVWTTEHLLKSIDDVKAFLEIPEEVFEETIYIENMEEEESRLGDRGIVMVDTDDPLYAAARLFSMEDFTILAMTEQDLFHQLVESRARIIQKRVEEVSRRFPGRLWRITGPEFACEPYLPPRLFDEYVVRYDRPIVEAIKKHGGYARLHAHGNIRNVLDHIVGMGVDAIDPIEPPPLGDVELRYVREHYGEQLVLFGNIEITELENLPTDQFREKVKRALDEGTSGTGRGFVLLPSASPYGRTISSLTMKNYEVMVELCES